MATNLFGSSNSSSNLESVDQKLITKPLNFSRYIPHELYSKSSGYDETSARRVSGLRLSHAIRTSYVPQLYDVSISKTSSTSQSKSFSSIYQETKHSLMFGTVDLGEEVAGSERSRIKSFKAFMVAYFVEWWLLEIISLSFSAICMGAIVAVLLTYDGLAIPDWPFGMTINGFISVFSNFAKSALLLSIAEAMGQLKCTHCFGLQILKS